MARFGAAVFAKAFWRLRQSHYLKKMKFFKLGNVENEKAGRDVPKGHCAVYVGEHRSRFVIPTWFLSHSVFTELLQKSADEFGFDHNLGVIIPCDEVLFQQLTSFISLAKKKRNNTYPCPVGFREMCSL